MHVVNHVHLPSLGIGGELRLIAVDQSRGITGFEMWIRTLEPGANTDTACHGGELALVALSGAGKLQIDGGPQRFQAPCTLVIPAGSPYILVNSGLTPLQLVQVFVPTPGAA